MKLQQRCGVSSRQPGEGCVGRERSEAAAPVPLKNTNNGRGGSGSVPRSKPDPAALRSLAAGAPP
ncbi:MAG: hypothetical protein RML37_11870, partial [Chitinophagales bacterium]|nr:hypothetical protein [Chitinophagales bacterium]